MKMQAAFLAFFSLLSLYYTDELMLYFTCCCSTKWSFWVWTSRLTRAFLCGVCMFSLCLHGFTLASSHSHVRWLITLTFTFHGYWANIAQSWMSFSPYVAVTSVTLHQRWWKRLAKYSLLVLFGQLYPKYKRLVDSCLMSTCSHSPNCCPKFGSTQLTECHSML